MNLEIILLFVLFVGLIGIGFKIADMSDKIEAILKKLEKEGFRE